MSVIEHISVPYVFTSDGDRIPITQIDGSFTTGTALVKAGDRYKVISAQGEGCET